MVLIDIDLTDPYSAAAMYNCFLICDACDSEPRLEQPSQFNLAGYQRVGQAAKVQGWFVAPIEGAEPAFQVYCATCAARRKLVPNWSQRFVPSEDLLAVADLASGPSNEQTRER